MNGSRTSSCFCRHLKVSNDAVSPKSLGSEFHVLGPQKEKDLSPNILDFNLEVTIIQIFYNLMTNLVVGMNCIIAMYLFDDRGVVINTL